MQKSEKNKTRRKRSKRGKAVRKPKPVVFKGLPYERLNYILMGVGIAMIVVGFVLLYFGDAVLSTILLVLGYMVVLPLALIWIPKKKRVPAEEPPSTSAPEVGDEATA